MSDKVVKIRKSGNSNILTVPKEIQPQAKEFRAFQGRDGMIVFIPKKNNPFKDADLIKQYQDSIQNEEFAGELFDSES
ncbi:antitoxin of toxin-antitoxin stability system [Bombilactobacillus folatiphilus]|uniref:Antitoxin of toxin-antitoxin stability system n=1 Tax=Bombilactobacillus folatiphilus TaxID=2923362 RepID=A0ABY4P8W5_9LACO|nr:antitoxin of toxin-antitoxin stability system [Bombilactobacillus folatiphilus]UQS82019.1 antitoxin of toxin-antitoxin stability system [Bombilactobacillus folatiphilus]